MWQWIVLWVASTLVGLLFGQQRARGDGGPTEETGNFPSVEEDRSIIVIQGTEEIEAGTITVRRGKDLIAIKQSAGKK